MPPSPPDKPVSPPAVVIKSPRDATTWALVYRRRTREKPREHGLKLIGALGALLVHVLILLGTMIGSPYELPPRAQPKGNALIVRLIENKLEPPPPPPVRGVPPKEHGPTHRGNTAHVARVTHEASTAAPITAPTQPLSPAPKQPPVVAQSKQTAAAKVKPVATPLPPISLPKPSPLPIEQPVPTGLPPPPLTLQAVQAPQPVPPPAQPEPLRKAQPEGTQPMPPLPSLALPTQSAQSAQTITPPHVAVEKPSLAPAPMPSVAAMSSEQAASPPSPALQPVPLPAQAAPTVNLQASATPLATAQAPEISQQILAPVVRPQESPQLTPLPAAAAAAPSLNAAPAAPALQIEAPALAMPEAALRPQLSPSSAPAPATPAQAKAAPSSVPGEKQQEASTSSTNASAPANASANESNASASTAPDARPEGSENGNPGQPNGVIQPQGQSNIGEQTPASPAIGTGRAAGEHGGGTPGTPNGTYIQLKPRGDTEIMSHNTHLPDYKPTRFDQYWTPEGESSIDTALRHAVEKTTVKHTFNLPKGVRIECAVTPLLPSALFGCRNPDPPAERLPQKMYDRLNLPSANPSIPKAEAAAAASTPPPAKPVVLDNSAECAAARVSGGPLPPNCEAGAAPPVAPPSVTPLHVPTPASSSWVPASDQFH